MDPISISNHELTTHLLPGGLPGCPPSPPPCTLIHMGGSANPARTGQSQTQPGGPAEACRHEHVVQTSFSPRALPNSTGQSLNKRVCPAQRLLLRSPRQGQLRSLRRRSGLLCGAHQAQGGPGSRQMEAASPQAEGTDPGARLLSLLHARPLANSSWPRQVLPWLRPPRVTCVNVPQPHRQQELSSFAQKHREPPQGRTRGGTGEEPAGTPPARLSCPACSR